MCVVISDWTGGFGPSSVKNNRNAVSVKSCTFGPPKDSVNATDNIFAVLLGLKNATRRRKAERQYQAEIEQMTQAKDSEPIRFFHGDLRKMVPCMFLRAISIADKAERPQLTGTIGFSSANHRCFGVSGLLKMPRCTTNIANYLANSHVKRKLKFGWSAKFVNAAVGSINNGVIFPACNKCRQAGLKKLGLQFKKDRKKNNEAMEDAVEEEANVEEEVCKECSNWDLLNKDIDLSSLQHKDHPLEITQGSPVDPPKGRDTFGEGM